MSENVSTKAKNLLEDNHQQDQDKKVLELLYKLNNKIENIEQKQTDILVELKNVSNTIFDPEKGLYARIKYIEHINANVNSERMLILEQDINQLKKWKSSITKALWVIVPALGSLIVKLIWELVAARVH